MLENGLCVAGPVSSAFALSAPCPLALLPYVVSSKGRIDSVKLVRRQNVREAKTLCYQLSPHSETGNLFAQIVLWEKQKSQAIVWVNEKKSANDGWVEIGDPALINPVPNGFEELDLGEAWLKETGTEPVFAVWAVRCDLVPDSEKKEIKNAIDRSLREYHDDSDRYDLTAAKKLGLPLDSVKNYLKKISQNLCHSHLVSLKTMATIGSTYKLLPQSSLKRVESWMEDKFLFDSWRSFE
ncbi:hypothetical protein HYY75_01760 [bacterium]|nr:hypothetical protein [bacterium]